MALSRVKVWIPGDILTASDLNGEFNNILNNPISLISPTTGAINFQLQSHTNLLPSAITATSGNDYDVLTRTSNGATVFAPPALLRSIDLSPGSATFTSSYFPTLQKSTDSLRPVNTLLFHSSQQESAHFYVPITTAFNSVTTASLYLHIACTSSGGLSVWQGNTRMVNSGSTWIVVGSTNVSSTLTVGSAGDITTLSIPLTASSWTPGGILQVRIDRTTDASNTSTGLYLHRAALRILTV